MVAGFYFGQYPIPEYQDIEKAGRTEIIRPLFDVSENPGPPAFSDLVGSTACDHLLLVPPVNNIRLPAFAQHLNLWITNIH